MPDKQILVSVIVATKNRRSHALKLIKQLSYLDDTPYWELIIIDNGSNDQTLEALNAQTINYPITILSEPATGKGRALNLGIKYALGELLVFTDDDITPSKNWLKALYHASEEHEGMEVFGGKVCVNTEHVPSWVLDSFNLQTLLLSEHDLGNETITYNDEQYPIGPNMAIRKSCLDTSASPYPINLGPGTRVSVGDERAFLSQFSRATAKNRLYVGQSVVTHIPEAEELSIKHLTKRCFHGGMTKGLYGSSEGNRKSTSRLIYSRLMSCKSLHEIYCITLRALGSLYGHLIFKTQR